MTIIYISVYLAHHYAIDFLLNPLLQPDNLQPQEPGHSIPMNLTEQTNTKGKKGGEAGCSFTDF